MLFHSEHYNDNKSFALLLVMIGICIIIFVKYIRIQRVLIKYKRFFDDNISISIAELTKEVKTSKMGIVNELVLITSLNAYKKLKRCSIINFIGNE